MRLLLLPLLFALGCAPGAPDGDSSSSAANTAAGQVNGCDVSSFSPAGRAVLDALSGYSSSNGRSWGVACDDELDDDFLVQTPAMWGQPTSQYESACGDSGCDDDFKLARCTGQGDCAYGTCAPLDASVKHAGDEPTWLCQNESTRLLDRVYGIIVGGTRNVDIMSLATPNGRFDTAVTNALVRLNEQQPPVDDTSGSAPRLHVRFVHAEGAAASAGLLQRWLDAIGPDLRIRLSVVTVSDGAIWTHAKIVAADGRVAMVGGHNLFDWDYLGPDPVSDLSMVARGKAAMVAQQYANDAWSRANSYLTRENDVVSAPPLSGGDAVSGAFLDPYDPSLAESLSGHVRVIGAGTQGGLANTSSHPSDAALYAMIASAQHTVFLSQQGLDASLLSEQSGVVGSFLDARGIENALLASILKALQNGADVYLVISNLGNAYGPGKSAADTAGEIRDYVASHDGNMAAQLCDRLHVASLRLSTADAWDDLSPISNHAKLVMVDDTTFYIGSQNLYPGGLADALIPGLAEFGFFVDDTDAAARLRADYCDVVWGESVRVAVSGSDAPTCVL